MNNNMKTIIIIGFALFATFFGAGNLIFPPSIGIAAGDQWFTALIAFILSGIVLPMCTFIAVSQADGTEESIAKELGPLFSKVFVAAIMICGTIIIVLPRTAAVTYEIGITPFLPNVPPVIISAIFFLIVIYFAINPTTVMDKIGTFLTPVLLVMMGIIVFKGIFAPIGAPAALGATHVFKSSFVNGYQTLDALGAMGFSGAIMAAIIGKGYTDIKAQKRIALGCAGVAALGLLIIYGGLLYIGATGTSMFPADIEKTALLKGLVQKLLGNVGTTILAFAVIFACLTTAIGASAGAACFFERISDKRIPYKTSIIVMAAIGVLISTLKVEQIVNMAVPILLIVYPVVIVLVLLGIIKEKLPKYRKGIYRGAVYATLAVSVTEVLPMMGIKIEVLTKLVSSLPFANLGFSWLTPAVLCAILGWLLIKDKHDVSTDAKNAV